MTKTVLAFAGTNSTKSMNRAIANHAGAVLNAAHGVSIETLDLNDYEMPIYSPEREEEGGVPQLAHDFLAKLGSVDGFILSLAEHNGSYSAAFKNLFDWTSRLSQEVFQNKPMLLMATSPGPRAGLGVLQTAESAFPHFGGNIVATFNFGTFYDEFDSENGTLKSPELVAKLADAVGKLHSAL